MSSVCRVRGAYQGSTQCHTVILSKLSASSCGVERTEGALGFERQYRLLLFLLRLFEFCCRVRGLVALAAILIQGLCLFLVKFDVLQST